MAGGAIDSSTPAIIWVCAHLPIAVIEGVVLGFVVGLLAKVKPIMLARISQRQP
jgi:ABC-type Co2+ transport system permease subunit